MRKIFKLVIWLTASLLLQTSIYFYLDRVLLAPASSFQVGNAPGETSGRAYYPPNRHYMALVKKDRIEIYTMPDQKLNHTVDLKDISYFKWSEDRDLALVGLQKNISGYT